MDNQFEFKEDSSWAGNKDTIQQVELGLDEPQSSILKVQSQDSDEENDTKRKSVFNWIENFNNTDKMEASSK